VTPERLEQLLAELAAGRVTPADALERLKHFPTESLSFAQLDHHRSLRQGHPEVVFCAGKTVEQVVAICERLALHGGSFLGTRATEAQADALMARFTGLEWNPLGRTVLFRGTGVPTLAGTVVVACAGTSDLPVAEEAAVTVDALGAKVERLTDVGVAGLHRLLSASDTLHRGDVLIVVAGMEGALPSVVGGLVGVPVIAVPTSVGYGASFGGIAALLAMLNSCAAGVTVVNIDNGFGAAMAAIRILHARSR
jgi:NCAIR mutase (PurE)-related protein